MDSFVTGNSSAAYMQGRDVPELPVHRQRQDLGAQHSRRRIRQLHGYRPFGGVRSGAASHGRKLHRLREYVELDTDRAGHQLGLAQLLHEAEVGPSDVDNTDSDPRFVNAANGDFNLRGSSPCVNQGVFGPG